MSIIKFYKKVWFCVLVGSFASMAYGSNQLKNKRLDFYRQAKSVSCKHTLRFKLELPSNGMKGKKRPCFRSSEYYKKIFWEKKTYYTNWFKKYFKESMQKGTRFKQNSYFEPGKRQFKYIPTYTVLSGLSLVDFLEGVGEVAIDVCEFVGHGTVEVAKGIAMVGEKTIEGVQGFIEYEGHPRTEVNRLLRALIYSDLNEFKRLLEDYGKEKKAKIESEIDHDVNIKNKEKAKAKARAKIEDEVLLYEIGGTGETIINYIYSCERMEFLKYMCKRYGDDFLDKEAYKDGSLGIHLAAANGDLKMIKYILERRPKQFYAVNCIDNTPLDFAVQNNEEEKAIEVVEFFVKKDPELLRHRNVHGFTPMLIAAVFERFTIIEKIIDLDYTTIFDTRYNTEKGVIGYIIHYRRMGAFIRFIENNKEGDFMRRIKKRHDERIKKHESEIEALKEENKVLKEHIRQFQEKG